MKVKELKKLLDKFDHDLDVFCYTEDEIKNKKDDLFVLLDIESADETDAEKTRLDNGKPYLRFCKSATSKKIVILNVITNF